MIADPDVRDQYRAEWLNRFRTLTRQPRPRGPEEDRAAATSRRRGRPRPKPQGPLGAPGSTRSCGARCCRAWPAFRRRSATRPRRSPLLPLRDKAQRLRDLMLEAR